MVAGRQVSVTPTVMRAYQHPADARRHGDSQLEPAGGTIREPGDHTLGRSRGGLSTKVHLTCEHGQKPLPLVLSGGSG